MQNTKAQHQQRREKVSLTLRAQFETDSTVKRRRLTWLRTRANFSPQRNLRLPERTMFCANPNSTNFPALLYFSRLYSTQHLPRRNFYSTATSTCTPTPLLLSSALLSSTRLCSTLLCSTLLIMHLLYSTQLYSVLILLLLYFVLLYSANLSSSLHYPAILHSSLLYSSLLYTALLYSTFYFCLDSTSTLLYL